MRRRREIGRFKRSKRGGWEGEINTLTINRRKLRLVPNDNRVSEDAPPSASCSAGRRSVTLGRSGPAAILRANMFA